MNLSVDGVALRVAKRLRLEPCPHGLPYEVISATPIQPWGDGASARPLCDACVMAAVREALANADLIVRAVNVHDDLVAALEAIAKTCRAYAHLLGKE